jgi:hypothetical protein
MLGILILLASARAAVAAQAKPYEVFYRSPVKESLCLLLPGHPPKIVVPPSLDRWKTNDRLEISCDEKRFRDAPELRLEFFLAPAPPSQVFDFRWGQEAEGRVGFPRGQFFKDAGLCEKAKKLIEEAVGGGLKHATLHLMNAKVTVECSPDDRWGTSLNLRLALNQPEPPLSPEQRLKLLGR